jgi:hypothetical protein
MNPPPRRTRHPTKRRDDRASESSCTFVVLGFFTIQGEYTMLFTKRIQTAGRVVIAVLAPLILAVAPVAAQTKLPTDAPPAMTQAHVGTGLSTAGGPIAGSIHLDAQSNNWFKFKYSYDNSDSDNDPTDALVLLKMDKTGCASFEVWTRGRLQNPQHNSEDFDSRNDKIEPVGRGTPFNKGSIFVDGEEKAVVDAQTLTWLGSSEATETYFIVVKNKTNAACNYTLSIRGPDVSF